MGTAATGHIEEARFPKLEQATESLCGAGRQVWLAGLGVLAISGHETSHLFHLLVEKGREFEPSVKDSFKKVREDVSGTVGGVGKQTSHLFHVLVEKGKEFEPTVKDSWKKVREGVSSRVRSAGGKTEGAFDERILAAMQRLGVPTREDIQTLTRRVEAIASKLGIAQEEGTTAAGTEAEKPGSETTA
jgi:polyhydroxyalkanoate synthesis regulator phasin